MQIKPVKIGKYFIETAPAPKEYKPGRFGRGGKRQRIRDILNKRLTQTNIHAILKAR